MTTLQIQHPHTLTLADAQHAAETLAEKLQQRFGLHWQWHDESRNTLQLSGTGVEANIVVGVGQISLQGTLGFPVSLMKDTIEEQINAQLQRYFPS